MRLKWSPLPDHLSHLSQKLQDILDNWKGTPYLQQSMKPKYGVDCVRFACGALDDVYGIKRSPTRMYPADQSLHDREGAVAAMKWIMRRYEPNHRVDFKNDPVEPFDLVVSGPEHGGPGHALIVGVTKPQLWHIAGPNKFVYPTSMNFTGSGQKVFAVFRCSDREEQW